MYQAGILSAYPAARHAEVIQIEFAAGHNWNVSTVPLLSAEGSLSHNYGAFKRPVCERAKRTRASWKRRMTLRNGKRTKIHIVEGINPLVQFILAISLLVYSFSPFGETVRIVRTSHRCFPSRTTVFFALEEMLRI